MFCKSCGSMVPDGTAVCPTCSAPITPSQPAAPAFQQPAPAPAFGQAPAPALSSGSNAIAEKTKGLPVRLIAKISMILALVAFFLPFVSVSCNMDEMGSYSSEFENVSEELGTDDFGWGPYSGFNIMFGKLDGTKYYGIPEDMQEEAEEEMDDEMPSSLFGDDDDGNLGDGINFWMLLSFLCGAGTIAMLFVFENKQDKKSLICVCVGAAGLLFLLLGRLTFISNTKLAEVSAFGDFFVSHTKWGFLLCMLFFIVGTAACALDHLATGKRPAFLGGSGTPYPTSGGGYPMNPPQQPMNSFPQAPANNFGQPVNPAPPAVNPADPFAQPQQPVNPTDPFNPAPPQQPML